MKVRVQKNRRGERGPYMKFNLEPTAHPKGGEAWTVDQGGAPLGVIRRWEAETLDVRFSTRSTTFSKRRVTQWTAYDSRGVRIGIRDSRTAALLLLLEPEIEGESRP